MASIRLSWNTLNIGSLAQRAWPVNVALHARVQLSVSASNPGVKLYIRDFCFDDISGTHR